MSNSLGLDYFNIDVNIFDNPKIIKLIKRYGALGFMSYITILTNVYKKGYFLEASIDDLAHILLNRIGGKWISGQSKLQEIILYLASIDLISKELLNHNIISSKGIQKRFLLMTKNRKKDQNLSMHWLLEPVKKESTLAVDELETADDDFNENDYKHLSKEEQKKIKRKEARKKKLKESGPDKHYLTSCLVNYRYIEDYDLDIHRYNQLFDELNQLYDQDILFEATKYLCNYASRKTSPIFDKYHFFDKSIRENLSALSKKQAQGNQSLEAFLESL